MTYDETKRRFTAQVNLGALKMAIQFNRLTYQELADRAEVSKTTIGSLFNEARKTVNPETAAKIEKALRVEPGSIFLLKVLIVEPTSDTNTKLNPVKARAA